MDSGHSDPVDHLFNVFFFLLWVGPAVAAIAWSPWWLLAYVAVSLIVGL